MPAGFVTGSGKNVSDRLFAEEVSEIWISISCLADIRPRPA